jgi:hypothetical protein
VRPIDYSREILPILANECYACHGPDAAQRQADLRLDVRDMAVRGAILPGNAGRSPLVLRISSTSADERMPPPESKRPPLLPREIELVRQWIDQGAKFDVHWAYLPPRRPLAPAGADAAWCRNPIDCFIGAGYVRQGLRPAADADPRSLVRRLSFDLCGLPPSPGEVEAFAADPSPAAYQRLVDRLLASPHYGERMAVWWLDLARYADTCGYHSDNHRDVWLYRDYVIAAMNAGKRFDRFTVEQLAGDLLPGASLEERIASGYNRLLQTTEEGGAQPKEYAAKYAADRVRNAAAAWMGATLGCAECHDHKFDPYTTRDFYRFEAFFADVDELPTGRQPQTELPTAEQQARRAELDARLAALEKTLAAPAPAQAAAQAAWKAKREPLRREREALRHERDGLVASIPTSLVSRSVAPRLVRVLPRGNWQSDSGEVVTPAIPAFLGGLPAAGRRPTRLDLAHWLTGRDNPMAARVLVNRLWKLMFGQGIVKTADDFGTQGARPTHPELLDWLAVECLDCGWDLKHLLKLMAMSHVYRLSSRAAPETLVRDPANLWLARQGRFRLDAEFVRDNALAVAGLLSPKVGGPSVKPYQPAGYWAYLNFPPREYSADRGENQYRRGLYTYWQRTFLHPSLLAFDAPTREECCVDRPRSNTPLQALVLLDDPTYVEAARAFAVRVLGQGAADAAGRVQFAFRQALGRPARPDEAAALVCLYREHRRAYDRDQQAARALVSVGDSKPPDNLPPAELAAWTSVTRTILNLHETVTRE